MKNDIKKLILISLQEVYPSLEEIPEVQITVPKDKEHGDYSSNIAMVLCRFLKNNPKKIAETIVQNIKSPLIKNIEIAGPGFINFYIHTNNKLNLLTPILQKDPAFFNPNVGQQQSVHIEFVSANPTGPLHVGHGRGAAIGSSLAKILENTGYQVHKEYYVNDIGLQMDTLATSLWLRYLQLHGIALTFPEKGYQGSYIKNIANDFTDKFHDSFALKIDTFPENIEDWMALLKSSFNNLDFEKIKSFAYQSVLKGIKKDLEDFRVSYNHWYHEGSMVQNGLIKKTLDHLKSTPYVYEKDDALWFASTHFNDDKDRVLVRSNGALTYFASDIAYHYDKYKKGYDHIVDLWGSDHHGYVPRVKASLKALDCNNEKLKVKLVQFATLLRGQEQISMSTRSGEFITLRELFDEVGVDATRYYYCSRKADQHVNFDLELAKSKSNENPVFYIQYAHARICSVLDRCSFKNPIQSTKGLQLESELKLIQTLSQYPEKLSRCAKLFEPHHLTNYLHELASLFHSYYNQTRIQVDDTDLQSARLTLVYACKEVIAHGLDLLSISAPKSM